MDNPTVILTINAFRRSGYVFMSEQCTGIWFADTKHHNNRVKFDTWRQANNFIHALEAI